MIELIPASALAQHIAILGKTGSGKTSTAKLVVEYVVATGNRVCILDPIKSDWWGLTSSADGKRPGLPFQILGGPRAHVPLHPDAGAAIGELVGTGALPLSIIDMSEFKPGGQGRFFTAFAESLMKHMRGVLYLPIEEAHELAPKERSGIGDENMSVYYAKKLATAGRSKGIRLVVCTQSVQQLHNRVLGSCDTIVVHRMTAPADQEPVIKWLRGNVQDKEQRAAIEQSLPKLKTGEGWMCSGELAEPRRQQFPRIKTFDNSATPDSDAASLHVVTAPVDQVKLRALIGDAVQEAEANDPAKLKHRIRELERQLHRPEELAVDIEALKRAGDDGYKLGVKVTLERVAETVKIFDGPLSVIQNAIARFAEGIKVPGAPQFQYTVHPQNIKRSPATDRALSEMATHAAKANSNGITKAKQSPNNAGDLPPVQQRILNALAELEQLGSASPDRELVAFMSDYSNINSKGFANAIGALRSSGMIEPPSGGTVVLTDAGRSQANPPRKPRTPEELQERVIGMLGGASGRILQPLINAYPKSLPRQKVAEAAGYGNLNSKGFANSIGRLRTLGFIDYPDRGTIVAKPVLFLEASQ